MFKYAFERVKAIKIISQAFIETLDNLKNSIYAEEVDENNIVQRQFHKDAAQSQR